MSCIFAFIGSPGQLIIVGLIILLLFGNRLPSVMRSLGEGMTEFKKGLEGGAKPPETKQPIEETTEKQA